MTRVSRQCSINRNGLTLVEVIAGIGLIASLLVSLLFAFSAHVKQHRLAEWRLTAVERLDRQLVAWQSEGVGIPVPAEGQLSTEPPFFWRTETMKNSQTTRVSAEVVRIEVFRRDPSAKQTPILTLEVLQPANAEHAPLRQEGRTRE